MLISTAFKVKLVKNKVVFSAMESKIHIRIGRSKENDLVIDNDDIELFHLELFCDAYNNVFITDLNSKTGTFVNGIRMTGYTLLGLGDIVTMGANYELKWSKYQIDLKNQTKPIKPPLAVSNPLRTTKKTPPIQTSNEMNAEKKPSSSPSSKSVKAKPNYFSSINVQIVVIYALLSIGIYMIYLYI